VSGFVRVRFSIGVLAVGRSFSRRPEEMRELEGERQQEAEPAREPVLAGLKD
jgi:hypothetical protein